MSSRRYFLTAALAASAFPVDASARPSPSRPLTVVCWGDSLTQGGSGFQWPSVYASLTGDTVINKGVGGETSTQIADREVASGTLLANPTVIWAGRNNIWEPATIEADIARMVRALRHNRFLVLSILNGDGEPAGGWGYGIITQLNQRLGKTYGQRYVDVRSRLVASYDPALPEDVSAHISDIPPPSLRVDDLHLNQPGYDIVAQMVAERRWVLAGQKR